MRAFSLKVGIEDVSLTREKKLFTFFNKNGARMPLNLKIIIKYFCKLHHWSSNTSYLKFYSFDIVKYNDCLVFLQYLLFCLFASLPVAGTL